MKHPEWALKYKRKGTELRCIRGNYYLYEVSSKWNPEKKRAQKVSGKLIGKITPEGFIESPKRILQSRVPVINSVIVKEYGACRFILHFMEDIINRLRDSFPDLWESITAIAFLRLLHQSTIKNMPFHYQHSYLSNQFSTVSLTDKRISGLLRDIGIQRERIVQFCRSFIKNGDHILIDGTQIFSQSDNIEYSKLGYNNKSMYIPQVNLIFIFSSDLRSPIYYRLIPGNVREVRAFRLSLEESGIRDAVLIADKGFYSEENIQLIEDEKLRYIIPLKRNSQLVDYTVFKKTNKRDMNGYFKYNERYIWYYIQKSKNRLVITYQDDTLKSTEEKDYLNRIETNPEEYTIEGFYKIQSRLGTLSFVTNLIKTDMEKIYSLYKIRTNIENMFDVMKNLLNADRTYMQNGYSLEGWMFVNYIALQWYYKTYQLMIDKKLLSKYSPGDLLKYLSEIKKVKINDTWKISEITSKTQKLLSHLDLFQHIT
jgi:transposase